MNEEKKIKVLIAKPGLDGHDVGAKIVVRALLEAGMQVVYTGLRKSPEEIADTARRENVDVIGFSVMTGSHKPICERFSVLREEYGLCNIPWLVGGNIPQHDFESLRALGVNAIFPVGTPIQSIVNFIRESVQ